MNQLILLLPLFHSIFCFAEAQSSSNNAAGNFESVAAVMAFLVILFLVLVIYIKFWRRMGAIHNNQHTANGLISTSPRSFSGIDKMVIESLPFFKFSALKGLRAGLECAVCLSKFEDIEVLRLLPKCKHAFHINCVDQWLENHSSCPLCRQRISLEDLTYSNSLRFLSTQSEVRQSSNVELFVQREDSRRHGSSRFSIGGSFRMFDKEDEVPIRKDSDFVDENDKFLHKFNHKIIMSDVVQKNLSYDVLKTRWSNLSSSDLRFLNTEMLGDVKDMSPILLGNGMGDHLITSGTLSTHCQLVLSNRLSPFDSRTQESSIAQATEEDGGILKRDKEDKRSKKEFGTKFGKLSQNDSHPSSSGAIAYDPMRELHPNERRSMSEIAVYSRFEEFNGVKESSVPESATKEERLKRLWMPIARKTIQSYGKREKKYRHSNYTRQSLDV